jgi:hypothetical protein
MRAELLRRLIEHCRAAPSPPLSDLVVGRRLAPTLPAHPPGVHRQSAACYLASFVARSSCVGARTAADVASTLLWWCLDYAQAARRPAGSLSPARSGAPSTPPRALPSPRPGSPKSSDHTLFYTISQACFYVM